MRLIPIGSSTTLPPPHATLVKPLSTGMMHNNDIETCWPIARSKQVSGHSLHYSRYRFNISTLHVVLGAQSRGVYKLKCLTMREDCRMLPWAYRAERQMLLQTYALLLKGTRTRQQRPPGLGRELGHTACAPETEAKAKRVIATEYSMVGYLRKKARCCSAPRMCNAFQNLYASS